MPEYVLINLDIAKEILREVTLEHVKLREVKVTIHFPDDRKIVESAMKDPLLHQRMVDTVERLVRGDLAKLMAYQVGVADIKAKEALRAGNPAQATAAVESVEGRLAATRSQIIPKIESAAGQVWRELTRTKKEYAAYQVKCGIKIVGSAISTGMSIAALVSPPALAIALFKAAKDGLELYRNVWSAAVEAETMQKEVQKTLGTVATRFKDVSAKKAAAFERLLMPSSIQSPRRRRRRSRTTRTGRSSRGSKSRPTRRPRR